ncbi:hypothetical protein [Actinoplanes regularis]|uniref:hypothetical protein n=1 Tax=Actinoplanes regularis TaxID=52697 RepID=UPI0024A60778|nr:hypothetical protein [Actinoplanes regularis]GLW35196.1 hypothetical protein Areg01_81320 [Actinoplanes regularis]
MAALYAGRAVRRSRQPRYTTIRDSTVDEDGIERRTLLADAWSTPFERYSPVRRFPSYEGQKHYPGQWWSATMGAQAATFPPAGDTFDYVRPTTVESDYLDTAVSPAPWPTREDPAAEHRGGRPLLERERRTIAAIPRP